MLREVWLNIRIKKLNMHEGITMKVHVIQWEC